MNRKSIFYITLALSSLLCEGTAMAYAPKIELVFSDTQKICLNANNKTAFKFTYNYNTNTDFEYYSNINEISQTKQLVNVPMPNDQGDSKYIYTNFTISSAGDCGQREFNYVNLGNCYLSNVIPDSYQNKPYSYRITLTPQPTDEEPYGTKTYNINCNLVRMP